MNKRLVTFAVVVAAVVLVFSIKLSLIFPLATKYEAGVVKQPAKKYMILIDTEDCRLYLIENGQLVKRYLVAVGKAKTPTPIGFYKIVHKSDWGEGFGGRWMGLNVPWGKFGIHGTVFPGSIGSHASHGCIRMWNKDVKALYKIVPVGTPVLIVNGPYGPFGQKLRNLRAGDVGCDVMAVQKRLKELGFYKYNADGKFGPALKDALYRFQKSKGLPKRNLISKPEYNAMGIFEFE